MPVKTRHRKQNDKKTERCRQRARTALQKHLRRYQKSLAFVQRLEQALWHQAAGSTLAYMRACRRVMKNYKGERLGAKAVAARTTLQWLKKKDRRHWRELCCEKMQEKQAVLLKFSNNKSLLQCGRCKEFKVSYYQRQTRSADEPMSVFATCHACGKKWKQ